MTVLLVGATGMLGQMLRKELKVHNYSFHTLSKSTINDDTNHHSVDLTDEMSLRNVLSDIRPEVIINASAMTNLKLCESNPILAQKVHVRAVEILANSPGLKKIISYSTDSVYPGYHGGYKETDETAPSNEYAKSKLDGELMNFSSEATGVVLRTNIVGYNSPSGNSLFEWAYNSLKSKKIIQGYSNVYFNPLFVGDLAEISLKFLNIPELVEGVYNVGSHGGVSKFDFISMIQSYFNFDKQLVLESYLNPITESVRRPLDTRMNIDKTQELIGNLPSTQQTIVNLCQEFSKSLRL